MPGKQQLYNVLIAHQSTIPHYRISFYGAVAKLKPDWWDFRVAYDRHSKHSVFTEFIDSSAIEFEVHLTRTIGMRFRKKSYVIQTFVFGARRYDLFVLENAINNLAYPLSHLYRLFGRKVIYWGLGHDVNVPDPKGFKRLIEKFKSWLVRHSDGFLAYTQGIKRYLVERPGQYLPEDKIFVLNNTIDIDHHRKAFAKLSGRREALRKDLGVESKIVLIYVGRLGPGKNLELLSEVFQLLWSRNPQYHLFVVGLGDRSPFAGLLEHCGEEGITFHGGVVEPEAVAALAIASDLYVFPGDVGLGPIQALCYDLPPIVVDGKIHGPEFEYLDHDNAVILPEGTKAEPFAKAIDDLLSDTKRLAALKQNAWPSIKHLTIENMAQNFVDAVSTTLSR